ncbi:hypothetical protein ACTXMZ_02035 [Brachybacterium alimentarium]|uniref:hypothetical protein n=1 Tax=Brachybacterium alimentarium TaxID=47845 RepID=UPI003FD4D956
MGVVRGLRRGLVARRGLYRIVVFTLAFAFVVALFAVVLFALALAAVVAVVAVVAAVAVAVAGVVGITVFTSAVGVLRCPSKYRRHNLTILAFLAVLSCVVAGRNAPGLGLGLGLCRGAASRRGRPCSCRRLSGSLRRGLGVLILGLLRGRLLTFFRCAFLLCDRVFRLRHSWGYRRFICRRQFGSDGLDRIGLGGGAGVRSVGIGSLCECGQSGCGERDGEGCGAGEHA